MRRLSSVFLSLLFISLISRPSFAQTLDTAILGTVTDTSGAVIGGATITVLSPATGIEKKAVSAANGDYSVTYLTPGVYNLTVSASGFASNEQKGIVLEINQQAKINVSLRAGGTEQTVEVQATQPLLQSEDASLGVVIGKEQTEQLPLNGRRYEDLAILTPGTTVSDPDFHTSNGGATISSYGAQTTWGQFNIDGVTEVNNRSPYINIIPSVDSIQEFKVLTGNMEAQYGGGAGTVTNVQIKSGTNAFHGDLFEFVRNTAMDARNYFRTVPLPKQVLKQNQFGGTIGGPIIKDRTFFFGSYEGLRSVQETPSLANVLTVAQENGDFSALLPAVKLKNPYTGKLYPNNQIPVNTVAQNIAKSYLPLPNTTQNGENYSASTYGNLSVNQYIARVDHKINDANQLAVHFIYEYRHFPNHTANPNFGTIGTYPMFNVALQYLHTFSASMVNELLLGYDFEHVKQLSTRTNTDFTAASIGINGFVQPNGEPWPPSEQGFPVLGISGALTLGDTSSASNLDDSRTYQFIDNFSWTRGQHTLVFGAEVRHLQDNATTNNTPWGSITFNGVQTGNAFADFILGVPSSLITPEGVPLTMARQWRDSAYVQDNWKATSNLTINLGLRWDLWVPPHDNLDTSRTLDFSTPTPALVSLPDPLWHVSHLNFGPRVGFAYSFPHQFVVRSAYGVTWYGGKFDNINILQLNPPSDPSFSLTNGSTPSNPPTATIQNPVSPSIKPASANVTSLPADDTHRNLYVQTWNLTLSKQFGSNIVDVSYVGSKGTHQDTSIPYFNTGPPQKAGLSVNANRPFPTFGNIRMLDYHGASSYNGLNIHFQHRFSHELEFTTAYSYSHLLDNQGGDTNGSSRNQTQIPTAKEWASGLTDQRHDLSLSLLYQLPQLSGGNLMERAALNGWGVSTIFQAIAGTPVWIYQSVDGQNNGNAYQRPDLVPGQALTVPNRTIGKWFNTSAFAESVGHYGSTPRNPLTGFPIHPLTLAVHRSFPLPFEGQRVEFRIEAFNALNNPQFAAPSGVQGTSNFGKITATTIDNRELQLALKYYF